MHSLRRHAAKVCSCLVLAAVGFAFAGCSDDNPAAPEDNTPAESFSNMSFDRLGVAVVPGATSAIEVTPLAGALEPFTVSSSDEGVATVIGSITAAADGAAATGTISVTGAGAGTATITVSTGSGDKRQFPVTVYDPTVLDAGELLIKFTGEFGSRYHDSGSGADNDGDFYMPIAPAGYYPLGAIGFAGYQNPNDLKSAALVVKDKGTSPANPPLKAPDDYEMVWHNGVWLTYPINGWYPDGNVTGAFWRPIPPPGYVALGVVVYNWTPGGDINANNPANQKPPLDAVMCVREDLTRTAGIGGYAWHDAGNGLSDRFFRADQLVIPSTYEQMLVAPNTVVAHASHAVNDISNPVANVLLIKPQVVMDADYYSTRWRPELTSLADPGASSQPLKTRAILVPFNAFTDANKDVNWKVANSPFYLLEREFYWDEECWTSAFNDCQLDYTAGTGKNETNTTWEQESVTASEEVGFELKGVGGKVKSTVTKTMGFATSTGVSAFYEVKVASSVPAPGEGRILATWKAANRFTLHRHNGTTTEQVMSPWTIFENRFHSSRFP
jgi:hypothetical protein